jgi:hypothetical protein
LTTGDMNDLYRFDPGARLWINLTSAAAGAAPPPLDSFSFAAVDGKLFLFGGIYTPTKGERPTRTRVFFHAHTIRVG